MGDEDGVGHELVQEKRKSRLNEILPILISGPLASNGTFVNDHEVRKEGDDDSTGDGDDGGGGEKPKRAAHDQMACYKLQLEQLKQENEEFNSKATATFRDYAKLVSTYEFGLKHISDLNNIFDLKTISDLKKYFRLDT